MTLDLSANYIGTCTLVKIVWPDATHRYLVDTGFVSYDGASWYQYTDTQGEIVSIGTITNGGQEISTLDISISWSSTIFGYLLADKHQAALVYTYEAERNPSTGVLQVDNPKTWLIDGFEGIAKQEIKLTLASAISTILTTHDVTSNTSAYRATLVTTTDTAFDKISGVQSAPQAASNLNTGNQFLDAITGY